MAAPTFEEIAAVLYAGPPEDFVSSRKARAEEAADPGLASAVRALRKPSVAAWVVNLFAQERAGQLREALQLARELREAQDDLDAPALAKLGRERRALTKRLAETAGELAAARGERITPATLEAVEQSISAAFFDPAAASAVASGRLLRTITPSSTEDDIRDAVVGDIPALESEPRPTGELQARRARREAERRVAAAEKEQASAERELTTQDRALQLLRTRAKELTERASELEAELSRARADLKRVKQDLPDAEESREKAATRAEAAASAADLARKAREEL